ncbi:MAG: peptidase M19, partial [Gammaproteobacteria bacterium]|nr:peptidase M19 [Gammaproteobacteria bacterium]
RMDELGMIHDLAHISPSMIDDVLDLTNQPVLVSHTGVKGVLDSPRNLSDTHIQRIASNGGLIGIAFFPEAAGPQGTPDIVASIKYVRDLVGIEHVALGSDYDGTVTTPFDVTGLPLLVDEMLEQGFKEAEIRAVMGENMKRFLLENF